MTIYFDKETGEGLDFDWEALLRRVIAASLEQEGCPYECEINVTLTDNEGIRTMNQEFRALDVPTDVLSFPMVEYREAGDFSHLDGLQNKSRYFNMETGELLLGDIVISLERAWEQSEEYGHSLERELAFLTVHSMFHLMGYDHIEDEERNVMEAKQRQVLQTLGITRD